MDAMNLLELITRDNFHELKLGEWVWDNKQMDWGSDSFYYREQPIGFRKIERLGSHHFLDFPNSPWDLSISHWPIRVREYYEDNRFYRFKRGLDV